MLLLLASLASIVTASSSSSAPNIITLFADDLGWYDTSIYNPVSPTPRIEALAREEGLVLDRHYTYR